MRCLGRLQDWNDDKGFGFVVPNGGGTRAFVHIKAFERPPRRPANGDLVSYVLATDAKGRSNAGQVRFAAAPVRAPATGKARQWPRRLLATLFLGALALACWLGRLPAMVPAVYAVASLLTFFFYAMDKSAARQGQWRIPEKTLQLLSLLGGWPGALFAQETLRHKSAKSSFLIVFWATVVLNLCALAWWLQSGNADAPGAGFLGGIA